MTQENAGEDEEQNDTPQRAGSSVAHLTIPPVIYFAPASASDSVNPLVRSMKPCDTSARDL